MNSRKARGRYAPSPTGRLHLGNVRTALVAWLSVRSAGGTFVWRVEDLDAARNVAGAEEAAMDDLAWLGIDWDEGPENEGAFGPYRQSERTAHYEAALRRLAASDRLFPCRLSRKELQSIASAPHADGVTPYPLSFRPSRLEVDWYDRLLESRDAAVRFKVYAEPVQFVDLVAGPQAERVDETVGDFVLRRRDDVYAYQLAVVVDDLLMDIDEVVRGRDLLSSTARQIQLIRALDGRVPRYAHVPLVLNASGEKLSKRDQSLTLSAVRERGARPDQVLGYLAWSLGLIPSMESISASDLISRFSWDSIARSDWVMTDAHLEAILRL